MSNISILTKIYRKHLNLKTVLTKMVPYINVAYADHALL